MMKLQRKHILYVSLYVHLAYAGNFSFLSIYHMKIAYDLRVCTLSGVYQKRV
jgi:hypothetical protein